MHTVESLTPTAWDGYVGQDRLKTRIEAYMNYAYSGADEPRPLEHMFLHGPPGAGKTTLVRLIAKRYHQRLLIVKCPMQADDWRALRGFRAGIVFFDEVHLLKPADQGLLLTFLTEGKIKPPKDHEIHIPWLTVIAATTEREKVIDPLLGRFTLAPDYEPYTEEQLTTIVRNMAEMKSLELDTEEDYLTLGKAALGVPRNAQHLIVAGSVLAHDKKRAPTAAEILEFANLTDEGLTADHLEYLRIVGKQHGEPCGITHVANLMRIKPKAVELFERDLYHLGYIEFTGRGRRLSTEGMRRIGDLSTDSNDNEGGVWYDER
jgi:Holliday junction resolvasome RuvABC ATP-dependent DNA helicase subunit